MEDPRSTEPVPVLELQYQSGTRLREMDSIRLVAKWCIVLGGISLTGLAMRLSSPQGFRIPGHPMEVLSLVGESAIYGTSLCLIVCAVWVLNGRVRLARSLGIALAVFLSLEILIIVPDIFELSNISSGGGLTRKEIFEMVILQFLPYCLPPAILLTIIRQSAVRDAIKDMN